MEGLPRIDSGQNLDAPLAAFCDDAHKFVEGFREPISSSIPHIYLSALPFSPRDSMISSHFSDHFPNTMWVQNGRERHWSQLYRVLRGHKSTIRCVAFSPDGSRVVCGSEDSTIRIWDVETGKSVIGPLEGHRGTVGSVAFSPDGSRVVSGSYDHTIRIWDV